MTFRAHPIILVAAAAALLGSTLAPVAGAAEPDVSAAPAPAQGRPEPASHGKPVHPDKTVVAPVVADFPNASFETGTFLNWQFDEGSADVAIVPKNPPDPCTQPEMPSDGNFMACMSTGNFYGGSSNGGVRSDLTSGPIRFDFKPGNIKITFDVDFQTEEPIMSIGHNDAFEARLVTAAGTFPIVQIDTFGRTEPGRGLSVDGFTELLGTQPGCGIVGLRTGHLKITWSKPFDAVMRSTIARGPVFVEFSITNQGDTANTSIACVDNIVVKVTKP